MDNESTSTVSESPTETMLAANTTEYLKSYCPADQAQREELPEVTLIKENPNAQESRAVYYANGLYAQMIDNIDQVIEDGTAKSKEFFDTNPNLADAYEEAANNAAILGRAVRAVAAGEFKFRPVRSSNSESEYTSNEINKNGLAYQVTILVRPQYLIGKDQRIAFIVERPIVSAPVTTYDTDRAFNWHEKLQARIDAGTPNVQIDIQIPSAGRASLIQNAHLEFSGAHGHHFDTGYSYRGDDRRVNGQTERISFQQILETYHQHFESRAASIPHVEE